MLFATTQESVDQEFREIQPTETIRKNLREKYFFGGTLNGTIQFEIPECISSNKNDLFPLTIFFYETNDYLKFKPIKSLNR